MYVVILLAYKAWAKTPFPGPQLLLPKLPGHCLSSMKHSSSNSAPMPLGCYKNYKSPQVKASGVKVPGP